MKPIVDSLKVLGESTKTLESLRDNLFAPKKLKFNSQICTTREQSERLLALGLKKETADMCWIPLNDGSCVIGISAEIMLDIIPAWSLHRLIEMRLDEEYSCGFNLNQGEDAFEKVIHHIEYHIKEGYFNKEYLV